jgi:ubiquinone/menaquinone biosynthesis C-methylase UbiE
MTDPFQNVDAAGPDFVVAFADAMDIRQSDPAMEALVSAYLDRLRFSPDGLTVEIGSGAGAVSRRIADRAAPGRVTGFEPSAGFIAEAEARKGDRPTLAFVKADGADLPLAEASADNAILHTVLTHVTDPAPIVGEAARVLKPGGRLVICDGDFSKGTLRNSRNDPLGACSDFFVEHFVTDAFIAGKLRSIVQAAGLSVLSFEVSPRVVTEAAGMIHWVAMTTAEMVARGEIRQPLADALVAEYNARAEAGTLYGFQAFVTLVAEKPA